MEWFVRAFLKASLTWLGLGITLGLTMSVVPTLVIYRPAHMHMNLLGFVAMMIFGVAYHVIPRFTGHALYSRRLAGAHWWMSNVGLLLMACGFLATPYASRIASVCVAIGGTLSACGAYAFIMNLWRTIDGPAAKPVAAKASAPTSRAGLPLADG